MVDRGIIEKALETIQTNVAELRKASDIDRESYLSDIRMRRFVERTLHVIIEACIDIAHHIISDEGLREPGTYREAFVVLHEHGIILKHDLPAYEKMAMFRNLLVHYYEKIDDEIVFGVFKDRLGDFDKYVTCVLNYLDEKR